MSRTFTSIADHEEAKLAASRAPCGQHYPPQPAPAVNMGGPTSTTAAATATTTAKEDGAGGGGDDEKQRTNRVRNQGKVDGLFRGCMDAIRTSHSVGQALRTAMLGAGLMTDERCYAELLSAFYLCTACLERRLASGDGDGDGDGAAAATLAAATNAAVGLRFTEGYEADLRHLLGESEWRAEVDAMASDVARRYIARIEQASDEELVAALFILQGPLAIGGGAALQPRVGKAFGKGATHVFEPVVGAGRGRRRQEFITAFDELLAQVPAAAAAGEAEGGAETKAQEDPRYETIVAACAEFMELNNQLMLACRVRPWWSKWLWGTAAVAVAAAAYAYSGGPRLTNGAASAVASSGGGGSAQAAS
jgi:hypothetical protein